MRKSVKLLMSTFLGMVVGIAATIIWAVTFDPHGGIELSRYLLPFSGPVLGAIYRNESIPVVIWYGFAVGQWAVLGVIIDAVRFYCFEKRAI